MNTILRVRISGQVADSPLISNEQLSAGGADSVRGYLESAALGDNVVNYQLEWHTPSLTSILSEHVQELRFLAFTDGARLRVKNPLAGQIDNYEIYGAGLGARLKVFKKLNVELDWARPLRELGNTKKNDDRTLFRVAWAF